jgi:hypothetical protein
MREDKIKNPITGKKTREPTFDIFVQLGSASIDFQVKYKDKVVSSCEACYKEEQ